MKQEIKILRQHGVQYIKDLRRQQLSPLFKGRPVISEEITDKEIASAAGVCPAGAVCSKTGSLDLGKCMFCGECVFINPDKIKFTNDYRIAANRREDLIIKPGQTGEIRLSENHVRAEIRRIFRKGLKLRQVSAGGDNACEMELNAAGNVNFDMGRFGIEFTASPRHADGIVITGPVSSAMSYALKNTYDAIPEPKLIILSGTDAISGGMFAESKAIDRSFLADKKIDLYVPGNPAHPLTFINGVLDLLGIRL